MYETAQGWINKALCDWNFRCRGLIEKNYLLTLSQAQGGMS